MPVSTTESGVVVYGDGTTVEFFFNFGVSSGASVKAGFILSGGVEEIPAVDYTVTLNTEAAGGTVLFGTAPTSGQPIYIFRVTPQTQLVGVTSQNKYNPRVVQAVWDKLTYLVQELEGKIIRALLVPPGTEPETLLVEIFEARATAVLSAIAAESWAESPTPPDGPGTKSAKTWAGQASGSASTASTQAGIATTKAGDAAGSAYEALTHAGTATDQAGIATTKAGDAAGFASNAEDSANLILDLTVTASTLDAGEPATASFNPLNGVMYLGLPKGADGTGTGDVRGPASAVADRVAAFDGTTGKLLKDGGALVSALAPLVSPALTGTPTAPTAAPGTNTTQLATTAFVAAATPTLATQAEAEAGVENTKTMTALRTKQAIAARAGTPDYTSSAITPALDYRGTLAHGLGVRPRRANLILTCVVADRGFSVGDQVEVSSGSYDASTSQGAQVAWDATNIYLGLYAILLRHKTTGTGGPGTWAAITYSSWSMQVQAWK